MNGAIAEPWVANSSAPNNAMVINIGASHNFLRRRKNEQNSATKLPILNSFQNCRLILDDPVVDGSRTIQ
jgi:hypothetical protein